MHKDLMVSCKPTWSHKHGTYSSLQPSLTWAVICRTNSTVFFYFFPMFFPNKAAKVFCFVLLFCCCNDKMYMVWFQCLLAYVQLFMSSLFLGFDATATNMFTYTLSCFCAMWLHSRARSVLFVFLFPSFVSVLCDVYTRLTLFVTHTCKTHIRSHNPHNPHLALDMRLLGVTGTPTASNQGSATVNVSLHMICSNMETTHPCNKKNKIPTIPINTMHSIRTVGCGYHMFCIHKYSKNNGTQKWMLRTHIPKLYAEKRQVCVSQASFHAWNCARR